jgi:hypothetical protein
MGLILDSSLLIAGERRGQHIWDILERVRTVQGETESALSAITVVELGNPSGKIRGRLQTTAGVCGRIMLGGPRPAGDSRDRSPGGEN